MDQIMGDDTYSFVKNTLLDNFLKLARVNVLTGEHEFLKYDTTVQEEGYGDIFSIYDYIARQVEDHMVLSEHAAEYVKYSDPEYVQRRIFECGDRRIVQSYKRRLHNGYVWVTFGIVIPNDVSRENPWALFYWQKADTDTTTMVDALTALSTIYYKILKINLTEDTFHAIKVANSEKDRFANRLGKISEWWQQFENSGYVYQEDIDVYHEFTDIERLKELFRKDNGAMQSCRYRRKIGEEWRWVQMELISSIEYTDDNQVLILYVRDVHDEYLKEKRNREALLDEYHRDALTRLYNRHKYDEDIQKMSKGEVSHLTVCYVDVNGLHELNNQLGHERGDDMLCSVADALKKYFPEESVYRIGGDEFVVLSSRLSKQSVEQIVDRVREELYKDHYEIAAGVESGRRELPIYKIIGAAELAMRADKEKYYRENGGSRKRRAINEELERTLTQKKYAERFLNVIANRFSGVYFVNLKTDMLQHIYMPYYFLELVEKADYCYSKAMNLYIQKYVKWEYYDAFKDVLDYSRLEERLRKEKIVAFTYEKVSGRRMSLSIIRQYDQNGESDETLWIFSNDEKTESR